MAITETSHQSGDPRMSEPLELARFFPYRVAVLATRISRRMLASYKEGFEVNVSEWRVLAHVARCERVSVRDIHSCVNLDKPTVSRAVKQLVARKLLSRDANPDDGRLIEITLTDEGRLVCRNIAQIAASFEADLLSSLQEEEKTVMLSAFEKLHRRLDADPLAPPRSRLDVVDQD